MYEGGFEFPQQRSRTLRVQCCPADKEAFMRLLFILGDEVDHRWRRRHGNPISLCYTIESGQTLRPLLAPSMAMFHKPASQTVNVYHPFRLPTTTGLLIGATSSTLAWSWTRSAAPRYIDFGAPIYPYWLLAAHTQAPSLSLYQLGSGNCAVEAGRPIPIEIINDRIL